MTKRKIFLVLSCIALQFLISLLFAQTQVKLILEMEQVKIFGGELYQVGYSSKENVLVGMTRKGIIGINLEGKSIGQLNFFPGQRAVLSEDGLFIGMMTHGREFIEHFELKTLKGESLFKADPKGMFISFLVSKDAKMVIGVEAEKPPLSQEVPYIYHFYEKNGKNVGSAKAVNTLRATFSPDGEAFVINVPKKGLAAYSQAGSMLWSIEKPYRAFAVSNRAHVAVGNSAERINQIDLLIEGKILGNYEFDGPIYNAAISPANKFIAVTDVRGFRLFDDRLRTIAKHDFEDKSIMINSVAVSDIGFAACGLIFDRGPKFPTEERYTKGEAVLLDPKGRIIWNNIYELRLSNAWIPKVFLIPIEANKMLLIVYTREKLYVYEHNF